MGRKRNAAGDQYHMLNDAARYPLLRSSFAHGTTEIWYMKPEVFRDVGMGLEFLATHFPGEYPEPYNLSKTHIMLGRIAEKNKNDIFGMMQGEIWSPEGEARTLIKMIGLAHTSMSIGDIAVINGSAWFTDSGAGWVNLGRVNKGE
jgi:hypothetical protein